jgi:hypothetical protein
MTLHPRAGLCDSCRHQKIIRNTRGSSFSMCTHPELPKYPRLPVLECRGFEPCEEEGEALRSRRPEVD